MDLSGRVLREVEFRDRLRGYDTEEVDEFLEKVALAVDSLQAELEAARSTATRVERDPVDDESLRRTLVLAQRTADLAIKEARDEAAGLLAESRSQAETLVGGAREEAKRLRESSEAEAAAKIAELETRRGELQAEIAALTAFVQAERDKFIDGLNQALDVVRMSLALPEREVAPAEDPRRHSRPPRRELDDDEAGPPTELVNAAAADEEEVDEEDEQLAEVGEGEVTGEQGSLALGRQPTAAAEPTDVDVSDVLSESQEAAIAEVESVVDPDEELWQRWAKGGELDSPTEPTRVLRSSPARGERRGRGSSA